MHDQCMHYCVDECETREICHENADCTNTKGSFTCDCQSGYEGDGYTVCRGTFYVQAKDYYAETHVQLLLSKG